MRSLLVCSTLIVLAGIAFFFGMSLAPAPSSMADSVAKEGAKEEPEIRPVLVELFTSQGCSSCPPADELLGMLESDPHRRVIPLSFHVDYWNRLGWRDPFSDARWSERQRLYNLALQTGRIYTPQLVVDGAAHCVGSDVAEVHRLIDRAADQPLEIQFELGVEPIGDSLRVTVKAQIVGAPQDDRRISVEALEPMEVIVVLAETGLETSVKTGENARRTLRNDFVVQELRSVFPLTKESMVGRGQVEMSLANVADRSRLRVVAFAQESESRRIRGSEVAKVF